MYECIDFLFYDNPGMRSEGKINTFHSALLTPYTSYMSYTYKV